MRVQKHFLTYVMLFFALSLMAHVHIPAGSTDTWSVQDLAPYVGDTVEFDMPVVVNTNAGRLMVSPWRMHEPLSQGPTGSEAYMTAVHINSSCGFTLSGVNEYHRCGEKIYHLKAVVNSVYGLTFVSGEWRGNTRADLEQSLPDLGDYRLLVCGFNLENYYLTYGSMGAKNDADHQKQRAKINNALTKINADIYGFAELQLGDEAVSEVMEDLNKNLPERHYTFFHDGKTGTSQKVEFVYDANVVEAIGTPEGSDAEGIKYRKKMVGFREKATGEKFVYSINHFKSMSGGADATEGRRVNEARAVVNLYRSYHQNASIKDDDLLLMGDLNTYANTEPIEILLNSGLIDLHRAFHADSSYSYVYGSKAGYIDHALASGTMYRQITGMAAYHINSDESDSYTYDKSDDRSMFRCSDHDPILVGLRLDSTLLYNPAPQVNTAEVIQGDANVLVVVNAHNDKQKSYYAVYSISGFLMERQEITSVYQEIPLPTNSGLYIVYIYADGQVFQRKVIVR